MKNKFNSSQAVGSRLKNLRQTKRWTQPEMAEQLQMSLSNYSKIEVGARTLQTQTAMLVCDLFSVTSDWLVFGKGDKTAYPTPDTSDPMVVKECVYPTADEERKQITLREAAEVIAHQMGVSVERVLEVVTKLAGELA